VIWNLCREDDGVRGLGSAAECEPRMRQTDNVALSRFVDGHSELRQALTNISNILGRAMRINPLAA